MIDTNREVAEVQLKQIEVSHVDDFCVGRKASITNDIAITLGKFNKYNCIKYNKKYIFYLLLVWND